MGRALKEYQRKRDFAKTPEPKGTATDSAPRAVRKRARAKATERGVLQYVVQKHAASRLHYDFRLEHDGVLLSWAVPKGPSLDPTQRRLAVHVEDHPIEYGSFEGTIPKGEYGGGTVMLWDRGTWEPNGDASAGLRKGHLEFVLHGEKLQGRFNLVRIRGKNGDDENWLLIKGHDEYARAAGDRDITTERLESVASGRDLDAIASDARSKTWSSNRAQSAGQRGHRTAKAKGRAQASRSPATRLKTAASSSSSKTRTSKRARISLKPGERANARAAALPRFIEPELATLARAAPQGEHWIHETKLDGYRTQCRIDGGKVRWSTRNGLDWTARFRSLSPAAIALPATHALIDGEIVVLRPDGVSDFQRLQNALREGDGAELTYFAFDLLHLDGYDVRACPLLERKALLAELLADAAPSMRYTDHIESRGPDFHRAACAHALEGIVSKDARQPYRSGRQREWLKVKCMHRQELVVGGWTEPKGSRTDFGALLLGYYDEQKELRYAGRVGAGFDARSLRAVQRGLTEMPRPAFLDPPRGAEGRDVHWVRPSTVIEVEFSGWTEGGKLRHASFEGVREDKPAEDIVREKPVDVGKPGRAAAGRVVATRTAKASTTPRKKSTSRTAPRRNAAPAAAEVAGVRISNPDRVLYPEQGLTKLDVARYYERIGDAILPHIERRLVSFVRCPEGAGGKCFFQRHPSAGFPDALHGQRDGASGRTYVWIDSVAGLVGLVQMGSLEIHPWGSRIDDLDAPDRMFFDLDPDAGVPWQRVKDAARLVRDLLVELGLESFLKTTGGKGLHVVVPLARRHDWELVKGFAHALAQTIERAGPDQFLAKASKAARKGKIYIDWLRNARSATAVAPFSTRARARATISVPVAWSELDALTAPDTFTVLDVQKIAQRKRDPWLGFAATKQSISAKAQRAVGMR